MTYVSRTQVPLGRLFLGGLDRLSQGRATAWHELEFFEDWSLDFSFHMFGKGRKRRWAHGLDQDQKMGWTGVSGSEPGSSLGTFSSDLDFFPENSAQQGSKDELRGSYRVPTLSKNDLFRTKEASGSPGAIWVLAWIGVYFIEKWYGSWRKIAEIIENL